MEKEKRQAAKKENVAISLKMWLPKKENGAIVLKIRVWLPEKRKLMAKEKTLFDKELIPTAEFKASPAN